MKFLFELNKNAHNEVVKTLEEMVTRNNMPNAEKIGDHKGCSLGSWYYNGGRRIMSGSPAFTQIENPHRIFHEKARQAVVAYQKGDKGQAGRLIDEIRGLSGTIVHLLDEMEIDLSKNE